MRWQTLSDWIITYLGSQVAPQSSANSIISDRNPSKKTKMQSNKLKYWCTDGYTYYIFKSLMKFSTFGSDPEKNNLEICPLTFTWIEKIPALNFQYPVSAFNIEFGHKKPFIGILFLENIYFYIYLGRFNTQCIGNRIKNKKSFITHSDEYKRQWTFFSLWWLKKLTDWPWPVKSRPLFSLLTLLVASQQFLL